jgi:hypothetical protein
MNKKYRIMIVIIALLLHDHLFCFGKKTIFVPRSQGLNSVLELVGWQKIMYAHDEDENYGTFAGSLEYNRSFRPKQIADFLFGGESFRFSGSRAVNRQKGDILADYFGLPIDFSSSVHVSPHISNVIIDLNWFHGFNGTVPGLFMMLHAPIVHTKWNLYFVEGNIVPGMVAYPAGYMSTQSIPAASLPQSVTQALQGKTTFGDMQEPLQYGKFFGRQTRNRVAELQVTVGWNYNQPRYHVGLSFRVGAPTGNATSAQFIFEDIVGNCHHWDIGFGLSGHGIAWQNEDEGKAFGIYVDAHISHLLKSMQKRSFDFMNNGPASRYILLEQIQAPSSGLLVNGVTPVNQYIGKLVPAINYTTFDTHISIGVQADIVVKGMYQKDGFEFDFGYNFWGRSKEKLHERCAFPANRFALKGDAQVYGFNATDNSMTVPLNATQSKATLFAGQPNGNAQFANTNADNAALATTTGSVILNQLNSADATSLNIPQMQVNGSNPAILLKDTDINNESGIVPRAISHKVFAHVNYIWDNGDDWDPYVGFGMSAELAHTDPDNNSGHSQWAIWIKSGLSY